MGTKLMMDPKRCTKCDEHKPRTSFYPHSTASKGVSAWCRDCTNRYARERQSTQRLATLASQRKSRLKTSFGLTLQDYDEMLAAQGGGCALCKSKVPGGRGRFAVDHCHVTGRVRSLLCNHCNLGLGMFRDDANLLKAAAHYLEAHRAISG